MPTSAGLRFVFMGTPAFAVPSLEHLYKSRHELAGIVTAPDKPGGRGRKLLQSAVKNWAIEHNSPLLQPEKLRAPDFLAALAELRADVFVVVAFRMLPELVWAMPRLGSVNLHASLLPAYRGAAPINYAIMNGEQETGLTTFRLTHEIDTGSLLLQERVNIPQGATAGELHDLLMVRGGPLLERSLDLLAADPHAGRPQPAMPDAPTAHKIFPADCELNPERPVREALNLILGLSPHPGAFYVMKGKTLKILNAHIADMNNDGPPGTILSDGKENLFLRCADGWLSLTEVQLEGKKRMLTPDFLRGFRF